MAQIPLPTRQTVPNSLAGVKPPYELADKSGLQNFGAALERTAGLTADRLIGIRAANEYHDFEGVVKAGEEGLINFVNANPYATEQQLAQERDKYLKSINTAASKLTTNLARQWAQNSYLSQRDAITAHTDGVIQGVIRRQNLEKRDLIREELIAAGDYEGLKNFWADTVAADDTIQPSHQRPIDKVDMNIIVDENAKTTGSGDIEFYGEGERDNPKPEKMTMAILNKASWDKLSKEEQEQAIVGEKLHGLTDVDEKYAQMRREFKSTLTPQQKAVDKRVYDELVKSGQEERSFEDWFEVSRLDAYIRGYIAPDRNDEWRKQGVYTPEQKNKLDKINEYINSPSIDSEIPEDLTNLSIPELQMREDLNRALAVQQKAAVDIALQDAYIALYAEGKSPDENMGAARKIITERTPATKWDTLFKDLEAEQKRYLDRKEIVQRQNGATLLQRIRDMQSGIPTDKPPTYSEALDLRRADLISEEGYNAAIDAFNGKGTVYDITDPKTELEIIRKIDQGAISPEGVRAYHGKGLSTKSVDDYSKLAGAGKPDSYSELLLDDLKKQRDAGYFISGETGEGDKPADMDTATRMENLRIFNAVDKSYRLWLADHPDATDAQKQEQYTRLITPARNESALKTFFSGMLWVTPVGYYRGWRWAGRKAGLLSSEPEPQKTDWSKLATDKDKEEVILPRLDAADKAAWEEYRKQGGSITKFMEIYQRATNAE
jgi:hypothetical protein